MWQWVQRVNTICRRHPLAFGVAISTYKAVTADVLAQKILEGKEKLDSQRILVFSCFGFFYCGLSQHAIYAVAYPWLVSTLALQQPARAAFQIAIDQVLHLPFFYFPTFYCASGFVQTLTGAASFSPQRIFMQWYSNVWSDVQRGFSFWLLRPIGISGSAQGITWSLEETSRHGCGPVPN